MTADFKMDPWHTTLIKRVVGVGAVHWFSAFIRWMIDGWVSQWFDEYLPRYKATIRIHLTPTYERNTAYRHGTLKVNIKSVENCSKITNMISRYICPLLTQSLLPRKCDVVYFNLLPCSFSNRSIFRQTINYPFYASSVAKSFVGMPLHKPLLAYS